jgi:uncharacterized phosphosugar-binding protein
MDKIKINKKDIAVLISESVNNTVGSIEKAKGGKKLKKLIAKTSKKIAGRVADQLKRDAKRTQKVSKSLKEAEGVLNGKKDKKVKTEKAPK